MSEDKQSSVTESKSKSWLDRIAQTDIPLTVYATIFITMALIWIFQDHLPELLVGLFTELLGAAFLLFIIDTLLVRSKTRRWKLVQDHIDYLVARNINRIRDGISARAFGFNPDIADDVPEEEQLVRISAQRAALLTEMEQQGPDAIRKRLVDQLLFTDNTYSYLNEKAEDLWDILNMKYSEYLDPQLVSSLMRLHMHLKDAGSHLRQYAKADKFPSAASYYHRIGRLGVSVTISEIIAIVNELKRQGYSEQANLSGSLVRDDHVV